MTFLSKAKELEDWCLEGSHRGDFELDEFRRECWEEILDVVRAAKPTLVYDSLDVKADLENAIELLDYKADIYNK